MIAERCIALAISVMAVVVRRWNEFAWLLKHGGLLVIVLGVHRNHVTEGHFIVVLVFLSHDDATVRCYPVLAATALCFSRSPVPGSIKQAADCLLIGTWSTRKAETMTRHLACDIQHL